MYSDTLDMDISFEVPVRHPALFNRETFDVPVRPMDAKGLTVTRPSHWVIVNYHWVSGEGFATLRLSFHTIFGLGACSSLLVSLRIFRFTFSFSSVLDCCFPFNIFPPGNLYIVTVFLLHLCDVYCVYICIYNVILYYILYYIITLYIYILLADLPVVDQVKLVGGGGGFPLGPFFFFFFFLQKLGPIFLEINSKFI